MSFYTVPEYEAWKEDHENGKGWNAKYYKVNGLAHFYLHHLLLLS